MKKISLFLLLLFVGILPVYADIEEYTRTESNHYGVNKKWNITSSNQSHIMATPYVDASLHIYDYADILSVSEENALKSELENFINIAKMDVVILTIDQPYYKDSFHENYAADFYDYNDFGLNFENYSGVLLLRNAYDSNPYFNVYMFGNAQLYFSYKRAEDMLDHIYPSIKNKEYLRGFQLFISDYLNYYKAGIPKEMKYYRVDDMGFLQKKFKPPFLFAFAASIAASALVVSLFIKKNKMIKVATKAEQYLNQDTIYYKKQEDKFVSTHTTSYTVNSTSSGSGGGFSSSSGSSGGGHSSGGGRHG